MTMTKNEEDKRKSIEKSSREGLHYENRMK